MVNALGTLDALSAYGRARGVVTSSAPQPLPSPVAGSQGPR